jgi:hypothetical protein
MNALAAIDQRTRRSAAWKVLIFSATALFRFSATRGLSNDHFVHLAGAQQMLFGDLPTRDFVDPGHPLQFVVSALGQMLMGRTLFAEAIVVAVMFGLAAALTAAVVEELTGSIALGALATLAEVFAFPHANGYAKLLVYALAFWLAGRYVRQPTTARLVALAASVAFAFYFRHDHGLYLGIGASLTVLLAPADEPRQWMRRLVVLAVAVVVMVAPYLVYVQAVLGLDQYFGAQTAYVRDTAQREAHTWPNPLTWPNTAEAILLYTYYLLPFLAALTLVFTPRTNERRALALALPIAVVGLLTTFGFVRGLPLNIRLPDPIVPAVVLAAWLAHRARQAQYRRGLTGLAMIGFAIGIYCLGRVGDFPAQLENAGLRANWFDLPAHLAERSAQLSERFSEVQVPSPTVSRLRPFFEYLDRCTTTDDRLFLHGYIPEVAYYARRPFAGGAYVLSYFISPASQRLVVDRLRRERVSFVLVASDYGELDESSPLVAEYLKPRFVPMTDVPVRDDLTIHILVAGQHRFAPPDPDTGWPCVRSAD